MKCLLIKMLMDTGSVSVCLCVCPVCVCVCVCVSMCVCVWGGEVKCVCVTQRCRMLVAKKCQTTVLKKGKRFYFSNIRIYLYLFLQAKK